jgi:ribosomal protein L17
MAKYRDEQLRHGAEALRAHIGGLLEENRELGDLHDAFEFYGAKKFSLGSSASSMRVGGKNQNGIDFFSQRGGRYHIGQCKMPEPDWLEAHPDDIKSFGPQGISDLREALDYLFAAVHTVTGVNDTVRALYAQLQQDRAKPDFSAAFFLLVYGQLNPKGREAYDSLKQDWESRETALKLELYEIDDLVDEFLIGSTHDQGEIEFALRVRDSKVLSVNDYCYFLANSRDIHQAFLEYGWRLFNLNVRYEIRNSSVNGDIVSSLEHSKARRRFHHYNNGLVILAKQFTIRQDQTVVTLKGAQIVNGLQTVKSIHNAVAAKKVSVDQLDNECVVQVKVIRNEDHEFIDTIVETTNNQNPMNPRNLKSQTKEQHTLQTLFANYSPRWFYQTKEGQWPSLIEENARFFKAIIGFPVNDFRPDPKRKMVGRVLDNEDLAKSWLAFLGFSDKAADRVTHFFETENDASENALYELAFRRHPTRDRWVEFGSKLVFDDDRDTSLAVGQASVDEYILAYLLWHYVKAFVPSPKDYRYDALQEGHLAGSFNKTGGSFQLSPTQEDAFLATSTTYQTWRLMANMKELLVEAAAFLLVK